MTALEKIKNQLIDRILVSNDEQLLKAIDTIINSSQSEKKLSLDSHQIEMLMMSESDIERGNLISEEELEKLDDEWMNLK